MEKDVPLTEEELEAQETALAEKADKKEDDVADEGGLYLLFWSHARG